MRVRRSAVELLIDAPAKLNLFFEVLGKRDDGFHEIETLMCPIDLCDTLQFQQEHSGQIKFECRRESASGGQNACGLDEVPEGPDNLVVRALELVRRRADVTCGIAVRLVKRIPAAAGLGGGSSDAAAALVAANDHWRLGRSIEELADWAAELGSDVPFFLLGGPAICRGRGERITPIEEIGEIHFVVVRPPEGLSTAAVYGACRPAEKPESVEPMISAFQRGDLNEVGRRLLNRLQPAAENLSPWVKRLQHEFSQLGFLGHGMSGSGTSYFGLCRHARHAMECAGRLELRSVGGVFAVRSCR